MIGLFRRESGGSGGSTLPDSETSSIQVSGVTTPTGGRSSTDKRPSSQAGILPIDEEISSEALGAAFRGLNAGPFPVTASHRRNNRRGSMLEMSG